MAPDLNSLPPQASSPISSTSPSTTRAPRRISISTAGARHANSPSPHSPSLSSLQAAATMNASLHNASPSHHPISMQRRRSSVLDNLTYNDPNVPSPGEMQHSDGSSNNNNNTNNSVPESQRLLHRRSFADPHHHRSRQPSLGEIHSTLETETEAQVNRLLHQIQVLRDQQAASSPSRSGGTTTTTTTQDQPPPPTTPLSAAGPSPGNPERTSPRLIPHNSNTSRPRPPAPRLSSFGSLGSTTSPALRPVSETLGSLSEDFFLGGGGGGHRDESAFYKAETQTLTRENQMLKARIRELERLVENSNGTTS
nr:hypothetical protein CFP56_72660 [Quercus suber]